MKNIIDLEINKIKATEEYPPYKCKMCGESVIENSQEICPICGWQDCNLLYQHPDCFGSPSILSFNQYKNVWENNKDAIRGIHLGKYRYVKKMFEENPNLYGGFSAEQLNIINKHKKDV